ncbi:MAG: carboxypeptidase regulatory-like domain-containing protein [Nitrospirae bacterium]|nr:carboxypeptidase regulatory-like domain-containing protein [Nitrospirota bacterium]
MKRGVVWAFALWVCVGGGISMADSGAVARIGVSGEVLELSHQVDGRTVVDTLPLHRAGAIRYFSAGVGLEERAAEYPPFSLKVVFTAGGKPYLSGVSVTIQLAKGGAVLTVPQDQVEGPWLFVDLPAGDYDVTATHRDNKQGLKGVKVEAGKQKIIHLRWAEDRGIAGGLADE